MAKEYDEIKTIKRIIGWGICGFLLVIILFGTFYIVPAGERAVLLTFGKASMEARGEGLNIKIPLIQQAVKMDVRTQKYEAELTAASKDMQDVKTKVAINYRIVPEAVPEIYKTIGVNYAEKVIYPMEQEINKATTAQFTAEELITKREQVRETMKKLLLEKLKERNIVVEEISIINFEFGAEFNKAIENKVVASQNKLKASIDLERIKIEKEQKITSAQAEAESLRLQKLEITEELIKLRQIEVQRLAIEKWDGKMPMVTGGAMPFIDISSVSQNQNQDIIQIGKTS